MVRPSSCSTTMTSMAPLKVAGLMEFHVLVTELLTLLTYCITRDGSWTNSRRGNYSFARRMGRQTRSTELGWPLDMYSSEAQC